MRRFLNMLNLFMSWKKNLKWPLVTRCTSSSQMCQGSVTNSEFLWENSVSRKQRLHTTSFLSYGKQGTRSKILRIPDSKLNSTKPALTSTRLELDRPHLYCFILYFLLVLFIIENYEFLVISLVISLINYAFLFFVIYASICLDLI